MNRKRQLLPFSKGAFSLEVEKRRDVICRTAEVAYPFIDEVELRKKKSASIAAWSSHLYRRAIPCRIRGHFKIVQETDRSISLKEPILSLQIGPMGNHPVLWAPHWLRTRSSSQMEQLSSRLYKRFMQTDCMCTQRCTSFIQTKASTDNRNSMAKRRDQLENTLSTVLRLSITDLDSGQCLPRKVRV